MYAGVDARSRSVLPTLRRGPEAIIARPFLPESNNAAVSFYWHNLKAPVIVDIGSLRAVLR